MPSTTTQPARPDTDAWPAFVVPWDDQSAGITDLSSLLEKPAGATGFIHVRAGHLATGDGRRWRFWGQNMTLAAPLPQSHLAPVLARRLAKFGVNCLRLHHIDHRWPEGLLLRHSTGTPAPIGRDQGVPWCSRDESTRALDPEALARLDWFVYCCRQNGIYFDFNLNVSRPFSAADGVKDADLVGFAKGLTYFDPQLIALQKEYAAQLLGHVNPFTGNRYADEPAIAMIEILNENSLLQFWVNGKLRGAAQLGQTWGDIPASYARDLDARWNEWLMTRYGNRAGLAAAWSEGLSRAESPAEGTVRRLSPEEFGQAGAERFCAEAAFYQNLEKSFLAEMSAYLRRDVGVKQIIVGTSDHDHGWSGLPMLAAQADLGIVDGHAYWQGYWATPNLRRNQRPAREWYEDWSIENSPMVDAPDASLPAQLSRSIVKGLPYIVSEINQHFPSDYACECLPVNTAYALLQDWDGIYWFGYAGGDWEGVFEFDPTLPKESQLLLTQALTRFEWMCNDPMKMAESAICALAFLRGDVQAARQLVERQAPRAWALESLRSAMPDKGHPYWLPYLPGRLGLVHRTAIAGFDAPTVSPAAGAVSLPAGPICSDTGELTWEDAPGDGRVIVDAPRYQAVIMRRGQRTTRNMSVDLETPFAAVQLASLDEGPIASAGRLWLVAAARVANTGMRWTPDGRCSLGKEWGHAPTRIEPVRATLILTDLTAATGAVLQPLDGCGQPCGAAQSFLATDAGLRIELDGKAGTLWYQIEVQREAAASAE